MEDILPEPFVEPVPEVKKPTTLPWTIVGILLGIIIVGGISTYYLYTKSKEIYPPEKVIVSEETIPDKKLLASITYITGKAYQLQGERRIELLEGDVIEESSIVLTEDDSRLVLQLDDGSVLSLDSNTKIALNNLDASLIEVQEEIGVLFSRVRKDGNHKYIVKAGNVVVESMGTAFSVENTDTVNVKVFESSVKIKKPFQEEKTVEENKEWNENVDNPTEIITEEIYNNEFLAWNLEKEKLVKEEDTTPEQEKEPETKPDSNASKGIKLYGESKDNGIFLSWTVEGIDTPNGFKIVKSQNLNPTFPEDGYIYVSDSNVRNYTLSLNDGKTWHIRVCRYNNDGSCEYYSNEIIKTAPEDNGEDVESIKLEVSKKSDSSVKLKWEVKGHSDMGYKVVWGRDSKPTYPLGEGDSYHYLDSSSAREDTVKDLKENKKYYFRVCEYLGGKCGTYSNEVSIEL